MLVLAIFGSVSSAKENKNKNKQDIKLQIFCTAKETINKKATYGMGEDIGKWYSQ